MALPNHATQTDPYLHEPKGASTAVAGTVYISDGAGSGSWGSPSAASPTGSVIGSSYTMVQTCITGATIMPYDNTIPQLTEGNLCMTGSITPSATTSVIEANVSLLTSLSVTGYVTGALFLGSAADAVATSAAQILTADDLKTLSFNFQMTAGSTAAQDWTVRAGGSATGTFTLNGQSATGIMGGKAVSTLTLREIKA
jgi:hypothetical protein